MISCDIDDWNASHVVKKNTQPAVKVAAGRIIEPIKLAKKRSAPDSEPPKKIRKIK